MSNLERHRLITAVSFWQRRRLHWFLAIFLPWHNVRIDQKISDCRDKITALDARTNIKTSRDITVNNVLNFKK